MSDKESKIVTGAYLAKGVVSKENLGGPAFYFSLVVTPGTFNVSGGGEITIPIAPPSGGRIDNIKGRIFPFELGEVSQIVSLEGDYYPNVVDQPIVAPPEQFSAILAVDSAWNGEGCFAYGNNVITEATVSTLES